MNYKDWVQVLAGPTDKKTVRGRLAVFLWISECSLFQYFRNDVFGNVHAGFFGKLLDFIPSYIIA